ncbi:MAG: hypothetical protein SVU88_02575 [Candidatus Nanohaloarchaea archaeon]|nr:hypothetical protein [Candidatus Nanohaloarchaea archaeon]
MDNVYEVEARERGEPTGTPGGNPMDVGTADVGADQSYQADDVDTRVPMGEVADVTRR